MPRRGNVPKREVLPDPQYNSVLVTKLVNSIMLDGKKGVAQKVVYGAFEIVENKTGKNGLEVFQQAMEKLQDMEKQRAHAGLQPLFADNHQVQRTAGQLVLASKAAGMDKIDSVVARLDGTGVFAVQGQCNDPAARRAAVECNHALSQPLEASSRQAEQLDAQPKQSPHQQQDQEFSRARGL